MIDYKLVLILALSIVLLYLYNRVDSLKEDLKSQKKIQSEQKVLISSIMKTQDTISQKNTEFDIHLRSTNEVITPVNKNNSIKPEVVCVDGICKLPSKNDSLNKVNITLLNNDKNTTDFSATENDSESESLNLTSSDNIIIYSNDKSDKESINENTKSSENLEEEKTEDFIENIEIVHDLQKDNNILLQTNTLDDIFNVESLIDKLSNEPIIFNKTFINTNLNNKPSSYIEIIDSSNSQNDENYNLDTNIQSYSDLDYDKLEEEKEEEEEISLNSKSNIDSVTLENLKNYKLNDLQKLAKTNNIELTLLRNGKVKNKTKKELYTELSQI